MKFTVSAAILATIAALASSVVGQSVDWHSQAVQQCALQDWAQIKSVVDEKLAANWKFLPTYIKDNLSKAGVVDANGSLLDSPTAEQVVILAEAFPSGIFHPFADSIVSECLANPPQPSSDEPTDSEEPSPSDEPSNSEGPSDSEEPSSSDEPSGSEEPSSSDEPSDSEGPSSSDEPSDSEEPSASDEPTDSQEPSASDEPTDSEGPSNSDEEQPSSTAPPPYSSSDEPSSTPVKCIPKPQY
ncbi:hypothetical protein IWW36_001404 [Coemansia brasiliensis]|uniref:Uncharacterized protein n=1 Tax=Coemansia brasiliensis TaxID=2650707 RepID=A0A9W8IHU6_9FUNG|nr:hypothetical protein IWW36_001404 [Coemansia brasiliensis]